MGIADLNRLTKGWRHQCSQPPVPQLVLGTITTLEDEQFFIGKLLSALCNMHIPLHTCLTPGIHIIGSFVSGSPIQKPSVYPFNCSVGIMVFANNARVPIRFA